MNGSDFVEELWQFEWDEKLSKTDNFKNIAREERALTTLTQVGAIHTIWKENFYRDQHWESMEKHGWSMWSNWDTADPALKLYDNIWYVTGFDYDRFVQFCANNGFSLNDNQAVEAIDGSGQDPDQAIEKPIAKLSLVQKVLKLNFNGVTYTLKHFDSTKRINYRLMKFLLDRPDEWVSRDNIAHFKMLSKAKDWPKLMGITGELKDIFINVDTKEQKIMLNPKKSLTPDEAENLKSIVNTLQTK